MNLNKLYIQKIIQNLSRIKGIYRLHFGYCSICMKHTLFVSFDPWLRDNYRCIRCLSIPRQRALIMALNKFYPHWRLATIHESSPSGAASFMLKAQCSMYSSSQYFPEITPGSYLNGIRCENLEAMSISNDSVDIFITQDVLEHVFNPPKAFQEIQRVLKPEGMHIFTVPVRFEKKSTECRVRLDNDTLIYVKSAEYHKNPVDNNGSLVTFDYGRDISFLIDECSNLKTAIYFHESRHYGLEGNFLEVYISRKK